APLLPYLPQLPPGQMPPHPRPFRRLIPFQHPLKVTPEPLQHPLNQSTVRSARQLGLAQLHKPNTCVLRPLQTRKKRLFIVHVRGGQVAFGQLRRPHNRRIGRRKLILIQPSRRHPAHRLAFRPVGLTIKTGYQPHIQANRLVWVVMTNIQQGSGLSNSNPQLLTQLPHQPIKPLLTILQLATWKLPQPTLMNMIRTPGDQNMPLLVADHGSDYVNTAHRAHCFGTSSENTSCSSSSPGITCSSAAQAPRSIRRQRGEQKGRYGKLSSQVTGALQVEHSTVLVMIILLVPVPGTVGAGHRPAHAARRDPCRSRYRHGRCADAPRAGRAPSEWLAPAPRAPCRRPWYGQSATPRAHPPPARAGSWDTARTPPAGPSPAE